MYINWYEKQMDLIQILLWIKARDAFLLIYTPTYFVPSSH